MKSFEELVATLSSEKLSFLCRLHAIVGRELLVTENIYDLIREDLVCTGPPLNRPSGEPSWHHSYKLTSRGVRFLEWLRSEGGDLSRTAGS